MRCFITKAEKLMAIRSRDDSDGYRVTAWRAQYIDTVFLNGQSVFALHRASRLLTPRFHSMCALQTLLLTRFYVSLHVQRCFCQLFFIKYICTCTSV